MKKLLLALAILMITVSCNAQSINLGTFGTNTYILRTESLRVCSTSNCLYIFGQEQEYIVAKIQVLRPEKDIRNNEDVLAYNKTVGYVEQTALFRIDGSRFVLLETATYDVNGNPIDRVDNTVKKEVFQSNTSTVSRDSNGTVTESRQNYDVYTRRIAWSNVFPGTPQEAITRAVLAYVNNNYAEIDASSKAYNYIKTE